MKEVVFKSGCTIGFKTKSEANKRITLLKNSFDGTDYKDFLVNRDSNGQYYVSFNFSVTTFKINEI
jgi:uncharacterized protein YegP (UPF0339 family)